MLPQSFSCSPKLYIHVQKAPSDLRLSVKQIKSLQLAHGFSEYLGIKISDALATLNVQAPTNSALLEGRWRLLFTTRPGSASPIQRTFTGVDAFTVYQEILFSTPAGARVNNIVDFGGRIGQLKVSHMPLRATNTASDRLCNDTCAFWPGSTYYDHPFLPSDVHCSCCQGTRPLSFRLSLRHSKTSPKLAAKQSAAFHTSAPGF